MNFLCEYIKLSYIYIIYDNIIREYIKLNREKMENDPN
jgi:hypothetical protein